MCFDIAAIRQRLHENPALSLPDDRDVHPLCCPGVRDPGATAGWQRKLAAAVLLAFVVMAAGSAFGETFFDTYDRAKVANSYLNTWQAAEGVALNWTGDISTCNPGTISQAYRTGVLNTINWARAMAGTGPVQFTEEFNRKALAGALIMAANQQISHFPPQDWRCWNQDGSAAAHYSNIGLLVPPPSNAFDAAIMDVRDVGNRDVGHRRILFNKFATLMGTGHIHAPYQWEMANYSLLYAQDDDSYTNRPARDPIVAWPPPGFIPYQTTFSRWHISLPYFLYSYEQWLNGNPFADATVTMTADGVPIPLTVEPYVPGGLGCYHITRSFQFCDKALVWVPYGPDFNYGGVEWLPPDNWKDYWPKPDHDTHYVVTIHNVKMNDGKMYDITYGVTVIDPSAPNPDAVAPRSLTITPVAPLPPDAGKAVAPMLELLLLDKP